MDPKTKYLKNGEFSYNIDTGFLGKGSFGSVHKGVITSTGQVVAIKALSLKLLEQYGDDIKEIMINQVAVMKDLSNHMLKYPCPFIVKIFDCFLTENNIYLVLEFCDDGDLARDLTKRTRIPEVEAKVIIYQIVRALDFIADLGVIHRDLKPDNIFKQKTKNGSIYKLGDFGLAVAKNNETQTAGTAPYMAPEMIRGDEYGIQVDIFSLGCVAHEILFGDIYFIADTESKVRQLVLKKEYKINQAGLISKEMEDFLQKCLRKNKHDRIKHKQLRSHPVFRDLEENYESIFGMIGQSNVSPHTPESPYQSKSMNFSERAYDPNYTIKFQQSSQVTMKRDVKWKVNNEVHKAIFLQQIGRRLLHVQRQNNISVYLIKDALYRLNKIRQSCKNHINFTDEGQQAWTQFCNGKQFPIFYEVITKALMHAVGIYQTQYKVFLNFLSNYPDQKEQALAKLGANKDQNINQQAIFSDLYGWTQLLAQKQDEESKILAQECILAMKINDINFDFSSHIKQRDQLSSQVLLKRIKTLG